VTGEAVILLRFFLKRNAIIKPATRRSKITISKKVFFLGLTTKVGVVAGGVGGTGRGGGGTVGNGSATGNSGIALTGVFWGKSIDDL